MRKGRDRELCTLHRDTRLETQREKPGKTNPMGRNRPHQRVAVNEGYSDLDSLLQGLGGKGGQPSVSKASIDAMPCVKIWESEI
ncbi:hypothetical protein DVH24_038768 [Malus domestica]|uniref:Uncharacterized protein n=1 Tax=Malus domestica TaxID=3750 RepID=A0A498KDP7_MALDO|nr:hypothetical protein DVH24_038768 [Malus domestica]